MITPGAETSGFSPSRLEGPRELKSANTSGVKLPEPNDAMLMVASGLATAKSRSASPLLRTTKKDGIVVPVVSIVKRLSPPALLSAVSSLVSLLKTITALAPAVAALLTLVAQGQVPRSKR